MTNNAKGNSGYRNSGDHNSGYRNSGDYNSGDHNSGIFNTKEPLMMAFNKLTNIKYSELARSDWPDFIDYLGLTKWIETTAMTEKEKEECPKHEITGGYLKVYEYKEAWKNAWDAAELEDRKKVFNLPNFDNEIFLEITGINAEKELKKRLLRKK